VPRPRDAKKHAPEAELGLTNTTTESALGLERVSRVEVIERHCEMTALLSARRGSLGIAIRGDAAQSVPGCGIDRKQNGDDDNLARAFREQYGQNHHADEGHR
jgi:hypothetical protein